MRNLPLLSPLLPFPLTACSPELAEPDNPPVPADASSFDSPAAESSLDSSNVSDTPNAIPVGVVRDKCHGSGFIGDIREEFAANHRRPRETLLGQRVCLEGEITHLQRNDLGR